MFSIRSAATLATLAIATQTFAQEGGYGQDHLGTVALGDDFGDAVEALLAEDFALDGEAANRAPGNPVPFEDALAQEFGAYMPRYKMIPDMPPSPNITPILVARLTKTGSNGVQVEVELSAPAQNQTDDDPTGTGGVFSIYEVHNFKNSETRGHTRDTFTAINDLQGSDPYCRERENDPPSMFWAWSPQGEATEEEVIDCGGFYDYESFENTLGDFDAWPEEPETSGVRFGMNIISSDPQFFAAADIVELLLIDLDAMRAAARAGYDAEIDKFSDQLMVLPADGS